MIKEISINVKIAMFFVLVLAAVAVTTITPTSTNAAAPKCYVLVCDEYGACYHKAITCPKL